MKQKEADNFRITKDKEGKPVVEESIPQIKDHIKNEL